MNVDPATNMMYVGGSTESSNFAPAENPHGYVYAVSEDGDWMWGQFFYNVSYAVSSIDGILLSQNGTVLNCLGQANNKPIIMNLNKAKGQIVKFYTIDPMEPKLKTSYIVSQSLYHEERSEDGLAYYYISFVQRIESKRFIHVLKFSASDLKIVWHISRTGKADVDDRPNIMVMDTNVQREFYLLGKMRKLQSTTEITPSDQQALGIRMNRMDGKILHYVAFHDMEDITAYVHPKGTNIFLGCGS